MDQYGIGYTEVENIDMVKLFCDRCGKEILTCGRCLKVEIQQVIHTKNNEFEITPDSLSASRVLCTKCDNQLKEFMKCQIVYF